MSSLSPEAGSSDANVEPITIYAMRGSAPCRAVIILARILNIPHEIVEVDLHSGEHKSDWFLQINPQHCLPTITDKSGALWESRAIMLHLMATIGEWTSPARTYQLIGATQPMNPNAAAHVLRGLFWDAQTLYPAIANYIYPQLFQSVPAPQLSAQRSALDSAIVSLFEQIDAARHRSTNRHSPWFCGTLEPTVADLAIAISLTMLQFVPDVLEVHAKVQPYVDQVAWRFEPHWSDVNRGFDEWLASMAERVSGEP